VFSLWGRSEKNVSRQSYRITASLVSDAGCNRASNEDCGLFIQPADPHVLLKKGSLFVVADGMGGHSAGEVASQMAVELISRIYYESRGDPISSLKRAFREANRQIYRAARKDPSLKGMGTTCTALVLQDGSAILAHIGDSRLYLIRNGEIYLMSEDHSAIMQMVRLGLISPEEARHHPSKNIILRALGNSPKAEISLWEEPLPVRAGDTFLLCSDGLYDLVEDEEIKQIALGADPRSACEQLVALAKERGGHDNITVCIASLESDLEALIYD
jgi:protein phosphatase